MVRAFAIVKKYQKYDLKLPQRSTKFSAGYDLQAADNFIIPSIWKHNVLLTLCKILHKNLLDNDDYKKAYQDFKPILVSTGMKVYLESDECLMIVNRSSNPLKRSLVVSNGVGIIDADYVDNPGNEGEIFIQMTNFGFRDLNIKKGERIGQGVFIKYLMTDQDEETEKSIRKNGFGSTGVGV